MVLAVLGHTLAALASIYLLVLLVRMVLDWVVFFRPLWRPSGLILVVANLVHALTDPPLRILRRRIPPLRLGGGVALDVGFMLLFVAVILVQRLGGMLVVLGRSLLVG